VTASKGQRLFLDHVIFLPASVLDTKLNLISKLVVVIITFLQIKVYEETEVVIKGEEFLLGVSIVRQQRFKNVNVTSSLDVP